MKILISILAIWFVALFLKVFTPSEPSKVVSAGLKRAPRIEIRESSNPTEAIQNLEEFNFTAPEQTGSVTRVYQWNTVGIRGHHLQTGKVRFDISKNELIRQIASFGVSEESLSFSYRKGNLARILERKRRAFAKRGILTNGSQYRPDYRWMIRQSRKPIQHVSQMLKQSFEKKSGKSGSDLIAYITNFVQNLDYRIPQSPREWPWKPQLQIVNCGVNMPLETLYNGWGDCDSKSVLLATLLGNLGNINTVFLEGNRHAFIGIAGMPGRNEHFVTHRNIKYRLIETTTPYPIGKISKKSWTGIQKEQFQVYQVQ
ncbi:MAG: hypothetical protein ACJ0BN_15990 [Limisphaerales bacterium]|nr:hypothetical protein [Pedosphaera sp.]MBL6841862.1 hypothetical protein [Verrucomicrobiae bacterium]HAW02569.1 hypothetical protein [Verrucomicrobiales bacterium]HBP56012.1 hypothetical protein [Verrucomicrobiales bacterium]HCZ03440.1 hypothetical protein [Verrucomicrobiales bacterium]|tara:strand:- start:17382 stop:18323 length:942 start_codon:yes stop_codon:yes gene_type:complete